jgi:hypothetical protein
METKTEIKETPVSSCNCKPKNFLFGLILVGIGTFFIIYENTNKQ